MQRKEHKTQITLYIIINTEVSSIPYLVTGNNALHAGKHAFELLITITVNYLK